MHERNVTTKYFFLGVIAGIIFLLAPWWLSLAAILVIIIKEVWGGHDGPAQA